jgi:transposase
MDPQFISIDLAKQVFQLHLVDATTGMVRSQVVKRTQLITFFANFPASRMVMEACGSAHFWTRKLCKLGHEVRLIAAQSMRPHVKSNKNDAADAALYASF